MREIKFRAWDAKRNMMFNVQTGFLPKGVTAKRNFCIGFNSTGLEVSEYEGKGYWRRFPVMQYTGLKDKNRVDIYEGDIVRFIYNSTPRETHVGIVRWDDHELAFTFDGLLIEPTPRKTMEVIGNIYENADLLANTVSE